MQAIVLPNILAQFTYVWVSSFCKNKKKITVKDMIKINFQYLLMQNNTIKMAYNSGSVLKRLNVYLRASRKRKRKSFQHC